MQTYPSSSLTSDQNWLTCAQLALNSELEKSDAVFRATSLLDTADCSLGHWESDKVSEVSVSPFVCLAFDFFREIKNFDLMNISDFLTLKLSDPAL